MENGDCDDVIRVDREIRLVTWSPDGAAEPASLDALVYLVQFARVMREIRVYLARWTVSSSSTLKQTNCQLFATSSQ